MEASLGNLEGGAYARGFICGRKFWDGCLSLPDGNLGRGSVYWEL